MRPIKASPTGIPAVFLLRRTGEFSQISLSSPKITHPISSSFKSSTMPVMPFSNISISPYSAFARPLTVAIPSPTVKTLPTSVAEGSGLKLSMVCFISGIMSVRFLIAADIFSFS